MVSMSALIWVGTLCFVGVCVGKQPYQDALDYHNEIRRQAALGQLVCNKSATDMTEMVWDEELQKMAAASAAKCVMAHDVDENGPGQNIARFGSTAHKCDEAHPDWRKGLKLWLDEKHQFDCNSIERYQFDKVVGHFTQMIWHSSCRVGCAMKCCNNSQLMFCDYKEAGNLINGKMYNVGEPPKNVLHPCKL